MGEPGTISESSFWGEGNDAEALQHYQTLLDTVDVGIFQLDAEGRFVGVNDTILERTGYARDELLGECVSVLLTEDDADRVRQDIRGGLGTGATGIDSLELPIVTAGGDRLPHELRADLLVDDGDFRGTVWVASDRSDEVDRSGTGETPDDSIATVLDEADIGVFVLTEEFEVAWIDETVEEYFGLDRDAVVGQDKRQLVEDSLKHRVADPDQFAATVLATYVDNATTERFECHVTAGADRAERWLEHYSRPIESGQYEGGRIELYYDVTDRKRSEDALQETEQRFHSLVDAVEEYAIFRLDEDGCVISWNEGARAIKGYERAEIVGEHFSTFYTDEDRAANVPERNLEAATEAGSIEDQGWRVRKDGTRFYATVTITAIYDEDGTHRGFLKVTRDTTDRYERERELEGELERIFGRISDGFYALDEDRQFTHVNEQAEQILGIDAEELLGTNVWTAFPELRGTTFEEHYRDAMATQESVAFEGYYPPNDAWYEVHAYPSETGLSVYFRDVTERKERERELRRTERRFESTFQDPNILVGLLEPDGTVLDINQTAMEYIDADLADVTGERFWETPWWGDGDDVQSDVRAWTERAAAGEYVDFEADLTRPDGDCYTLSGYFRPVTNDDGEVVSIIVSDRDITERKRRERELERTLDLLNKTERIADVAGWEIDPETTEPYWTDHLFDLLDVDYDEQPSLNEALDVYYTEADRNTVEDAIEEALESGEPFEVEVQFPRPTGDVGWLRIKGDPEVEDGTVVSLRGALQDVTEQVERERRLEDLIDRLEESNERLEQFAYAASHDLQEPLRMVSSYLRLIEHRYEDVLDEDGQEFLEFAVDGADRMREMIHGLLEYSRVEAAGSPLEPVDLEAVLEDVRDDLQLSIEESDAEITAGELPTVRGDASQLRQLFLNLLDNAIEYSGHEPPRIDVSTEAEGSAWLVSVRDEGIGIDLDDTDRIFEVFESLHPYDEHSGTGIGLALCERIVERHGGNIWVESEPGRGTTFSFTLPAASSDDSDGQ